MILRINEFVKKYHLIPNNHTIVVGLSGGPDSIFLLHILADMRKHKNLTLIAAHLDHQWRTNSADDVIFCKKVCDNLGITFVSRQALQLPTIKHNGSQEEIGRKLRRTFLESVAREHRADTIALAHHLQDQEETFFIRLMRGTTLSGLIGMRPKKGMYIRPLLETNKTDILTYLDTHKINYLIDPTNEQLSYLRNRIRARVVPACTEADQRFDANFTRTMHHLQQSEDYLESMTQRIFSEIVEGKGDKQWINVEKLLTLHPYMQKRILMHWIIQHQVPFYPTDSFLDEILRFLLNSENAKHDLHTTWKIIKKDAFAAITAQ